MRFPRIKIPWHLVGMIAAAAALSVALSFILIEVKRVSDENKELRTISGTLVHQLESIGQTPVVRPAPGETGPVGSPGPPGPVGPRGLTGQQGPVGPQGPDGQTGVSGQLGPAGPSGEPGADGVSGADGTDGQTGPQGPAGETGPQGPEGPSGPAGADGQDGRTPTRMTCTPEDLSGTQNCTVTEWE